jgi:hypothetical protein
MLKRLPKQAKLYLNGRSVGSITVRGFTDSWHFGEFAPSADFAEFAPLFGEWSLLLHADETAPEISRVARDELTRIEREIDQLRAELFFPETEQRIVADQINIDGDLVEWKLLEHPVTPADTSHQSPDQSHGAQG